MGSTGSIGIQTLDLLEASPNRFTVVALTARNNHELLTRQALRFLPSYVAIANEQKYCEVKQALAHLPIEVAAGDDAVEAAAALNDADTVVNAIVGYAGLAPTLAALKTGKRLCLANKESLVVAGELVTDIARQHGAKIVPIDSEHSAVWQCIESSRSRVEKIILTASGGPFRTFGLNEMENITPEQALKHPNWSMGAKITIDSASMMNKGFEVIEARWLFDVCESEIDVLVHPQSIVHSMVQFVNGSLMAQMAVPDMRIPIQHALDPDSADWVSPSSRLSLEQLQTLTFEKPDLNRFPNLATARSAMQTGGNVPCVLNAANEVAVSAFLEKKIRFLQMNRLIEKTIEKTPFIEHPTYQQIIEIDRNARSTAEQVLNQIK